MKTMPRLLLLAFILLLAACGGEPRADATLETQTTVGDEELDEPEQIDGP